MIDSIDTTDNEHCHFDRRVGIYAMWTIIVCLVMSVIALHVLEIPWAPLVLLFTASSLVPIFPLATRSRSIRFLFITSPILLCLLSIAFTSTLVVLVVAAWFYFLSNAASDIRKTILLQFCSAVLFFLALDLFILRHAVVNIWLTDVTHWYTQLIHNSRGFGQIGGPLQIHHRYLVFTIVATAPLAVGMRRTWLLSVLQALFVVASIPLNTYLGVWAPLLFSALSACAIVYSHVRCGGGHAVQLRHDAAWPHWSYLAHRGGITYFVVIFLLGAIAFHGSGIRASSADSASTDVPRVLFVNDHARNHHEGDHDDITHFEDLRSDNVDSFDRMRSQPFYTKLARQLLPALGYHVDIKSVGEIKPEQFADYRVVVLICLQNRLPDLHKTALLNAINAGTTNLLIAGDHTDILGVQKPFNDLMESLGVKLNYDSVIPFGQWNSQIEYAAHPINGMLACSYRGPESGYSVGASLCIDKAVAFPVLIAGDGFADEGTPGAPMFGGLGDMQYNDNEVVGGHILAVERPYGKGTILAIGDTALMQNTSVSRNFAYLASVFNYLARSSWRLNGFTIKYLSLACGALLLLGLGCRFSSKVAVACILLQLATSATATTLENSRNVIRSMKAGIVIVDDAHAETFRTHDTEKGIDVFLDFLQKDTSCLSLVTDCSDVIDLDNVKAVFLLAPNGTFTADEQTKLLDFVTRGGQLVCTLDFYIARAQTAWLDKLGCIVTPRILGAGQQVSLAEKSYTAIPRILETFALDLKSGWNNLITCYGKPVIAWRQFGKGRACVISDSHFFVNDALGAERETDASSYTFVTKLFAFLLGTS